MYCMMSPRENCEKLLLMLTGPMRYRYSLCFSRKYRMPFQSRNSGMGLRWYSLMMKERPSSSDLPQGGLKTPVHPEEALQVKTLHPVPPQNLLALAYPVGPHNLLFLVVPHKELVVIEIVLIDVHGTVGPLSHLPEGDLPQACPVHS